MVSTFKPYPATGWPLGERELLKSQTPNPLEYFLRYYALHDVYLFRDDFDGKALNTTNTYTVAAGSTATTWAISQTIEDGLNRGVTGTTAATSGLQIQYPATIFTGSRNAGCEVRWQTSDITEVRVEIGFTSGTLPAVNTTLVNSLTTPTFNTVTSAVLGVYDNASATTTMGLYSIGSAVSATKTAFTAPVPVNSTFQTVRLQINGTKATMWVNGINVAQPTADQVTAADVLAFVVSVKASNTTSKNVDLDYVLLWKDRALSSGT
jgi:hypothetical protein